MAEARKTAFINKVTIAILIMTTNRPPSCGRTGAQRAATQTGSVASPPPKTTRWSYHLDPLDHHHHCGRPHHHLDFHGPPGLCRDAFQLRFFRPVGSCWLQQDRHQLRLRAQTNLLVGTIERKQIINLMQAYELHGVEVYGRQRFNWLLLVVKKRIFEADRKKGGRGGRSTLSVLTVGKCKNADPFFIEVWFFDTQNNFYLIVKGLKNAFFMSFRLLQYRYPTILWQESSTRVKLEILVVRWKWLVSRNTYNHNIRPNIH